MGISLDLDTYIPSGPGAIVARIIPTYPQDLHPVIPIPPKISNPVVKHERRCQVTVTIAVGK